ncbi:hypothetical protein HDU76_011522, partial [Blyttiomyces sp. JEL0837]
KRISGKQSVRLPNYGEAVGVGNSGNAIAACLVKNSNELSIPQYSLPTTSRSQSTPVPLISVTTGGYQSVSTTQPMRSPNLLGISSSPPVRQTENDSKQLGAVDDKKSVEVTIEMVRNDSAGTNIEADLQKEWGPYFNWSPEQVTVWAKEKRFDDIVLVAFNRYEVDGTILQSLDRVVLKSDLGIADIKICTGILKSLELLKLAAQSASVSAANGAALSCDIAS